MIVFSSRFTPGLQNGADVQFNKGEQVTYRLESGALVEIIIDSEVMTHPLLLKDNELGYGYESIFLDDHQRYFAASKNIVNWNGKVPVVQGSGGSLLGIDLKDLTDEAAEDTK